jgi:hypothetical protein
MTDGAGRPLVPAQLLAARAITGRTGLVLGGGMLVAIREGVRFCKDCGLSVKFDGACLFPFSWQQPRATR